MAPRTLVFIAFCAMSVSAFNFAVKVKSSLQFDVDAAKERPVTKVVNLLKDMQKQLEKEAEEDEEIYEKMACWCETNDKAKTKAIADAEAHIEDLTSSIEELSASSARLNTEIKNLEAEVAENQDALDKATAMRAKDLAEFNSEEKDMLQAISALKSAIIVLSKNHPGAALLQISSMEPNMIMQVAATLQEEYRRHASLLDGVLTSAQKRQVTVFAQAPMDFLQDSGPSYAPASGAIFGILKQMKETFESNLSQSQKDELAGQKAFEDLKAAKEDEIATGQEQVDMKTQELATTDEKLVESKQDLTDTRDSLSADEKFLMDLKQTCQMSDQEWEERQKTRQLEIEAVSKALAILTSDDARDLFSKTLGFVQKNAEMHSTSRTKASELLLAVAKKNNNAQLIALSNMIRLDAFVKVLKAIDDMIAALLTEKQDEIKLKDFCVEGFYQNERSTEKKDREKADLTQLISDLGMQIDELTQAIESLKAEIAEMQEQLKRAGEDREAENKEFQLTVADQRATQKLLKSCLGVLKGFYDKKAKAALMQQGKADQPAPPGFKAYKKSAASGGVMGMIQGIIDDAIALEKEATQSEADSQKAYEDFVTETQRSVDEKSKEIVNKAELKSKAEADKIEAEENKENVMLDLDQLANEALDLHKTCDFVVKNFEIRQTGRDEEIEALKQVKAILRGAK